MSDTLQEEEDQMIATAICICHKFIRLHDGTCPVHGFVRKQPDDESTWCNDCHGYTHMPWCPSYRAVDEVSDEEYQQLASEHQPAARGGGDDALSLAKENHYVYGSDRSERLLRVVMADHEQHHSLVAERGRLILTIKNALDKVFNDGKQPDGWVQIQQSAIDELRAMVQSIEQRSTSGG